ncbi:GNAT family N-acetyltransferase [Salibacter sp.]|uniref:GNAT family N-acetyltransferase n=1 Tax=Salibacter sp. TaxID=2010995 RepID=UPI00286FBAE3|nr:GNAT family N-acetyltransferase [Salibacter sp.]MDR9398100.1 GNAT family N-acetyltransferase [Salibacter sp.]MDR9487278.1 GNAT family N-acetyltransferase [Salibacter sp.]
MKFKTLNQNSGKDKLHSNDVIADFLHEHLEEFGDPKEDILKALNYVFDHGGFILLGLENKEIVGAVVINDTGMSGYIPEHILVYIAVHHNQRGKGAGKKLMEGALKLCAGDVALHVEDNNPAKFLYEKVGFTNPYLEMRWKRKQ